MYEKKKIPIKRIVIYIYVIIVVVVLSIIAYSLFSGLSKTANKEAQRASYELNASIYNEIYNYIDFSEHINHVYGDLVSNNLINFSDKETRETLIMSFMNNHSLNISVFAYINENNQFYGGIRRDSDTLEIYALDQTTNWHLSVQNVNDENKDIIIGSDLIDFKTENWYELAKQTNENIILPVYYNEHISMHTIRSVFPINDDNNVFQGVIYLEINLDNMQQIIESLIEDDNYSAYIIDKNTKSDRLALEAIEAEKQVKEAEKLMKLSKAPVDQLVVGINERDIQDILINSSIINEAGEDKYQLCSEAISSINEGWNTLFEKVVICIRSEIIYKIKGISRNFTASTFKNIELETSNLARFIVSQYGEPKLVAQNLSYTALTDDNNRMNAYLWENNNQRIKIDYICVKGNFKYEFHAEIE